jgi:hypothetical protein
LEEQIRRNIQKRKGNPYIFDIFGEIMIDKETERKIVDYLIDLTDGYEVTKYDSVRFKISKPHLGKVDFIVVEREENQWVTYNIGRVVGTLDEILPIARKSLISKILSEIDFLKKSINHLEEKILGEQE